MVIHDYISFAPTAQLKKNIQGEPDILGVPSHQPHKDHLPIALDCLWLERG
jgi:hypothetical protein